MDDIAAIQSQLARIAEQEAALRAERKRLERELAIAKAGRVFDGPVVDASGSPVDTAIDGIAASASGSGEAR